MTYEEFLKTRFNIPEAEYNALVNWNEAPLSLLDISSKYALYHTTRFYEYIFDLFLLNIIRLYNVKPLVSRIKYNFLFFKLDSQFDVFSDEIKIKILEKYYELLSIYKKYYTGKVNEKSPFNYYQEEILKIEPNFTRKNINKLIQEFSDADLTCNFDRWGSQYGFYSATISSLFAVVVNNLRYDLLIFECAKELLNKREYPTDFESWLLSQHLSKEYIDAYLKQNPNFKEHVLEIYNKFIYWFELDRSFTI